MSILKTVEIAPEVYWVGGNDQHGGLQCNPYLIVDGDEAVLIDPGSVLDFEDVLSNIKSIIPLKNIKWVILHHQDPDFCASVPLFEQEGAKFTIITHWRTQTLLRYYGIKSDYYIVNVNDFKLTLNSGRVLGFVQTPYLHFPGSIATYDYQSKILFSSDLFGAFSFEWDLYADEDYIEKMKAFHEHYMPSNDILRPIMEILLGMDIALIAPQHGSIIKNDTVKYIKILRDLECGAFLNPIKKDLAKSGGYKSICSNILKRYVSIYSKKEVLDVIADLEITLEEESLEISDYNYRGIELWNILFERVLAKKGIPWLLIIEPLVKKLSQEYDLSVPEIFETTLKQSEERAANLSRENEWLKELNLKLNNSIKEADEKLTRCPVTGLYNYNFFRSYLDNELRDIEDSKQKPGLIIISIDRMSKIKFSYGDDEIDETMRNLVYIINQFKDNSSLLFRLQGFEVAVYLTHTNKEIMISLAEKIRNAVAYSEMFIEKMTVSVGLAGIDEIIASTVKDPAAAMYKTAIDRVKQAKAMGMNIVCSSSSIDHYQKENGSILIIDTDQTSVEIMKRTIEKLKFHALTAEDGEEALRIIEREPIDLIISEVMIPKIDGFLVREKLLMQSQTKNIPFIFISYLKNNDSVRHAAALEVEHYFKKPFMLAELEGLIKNKLKSSRIYGR